MSTLYDLVRFSNNITEKLIENGGELTEEILEILNFTEEQLPKKVDSYATLDERLEKEIEYFKEKEEKIKRIRRAAETLQENIRSRIKICMLNGNLQTIDGVDFAFRLKKSQPRLLLTDVAPEWEITITTTEPDKERIKAALKAGKEISGARLEPSYALTIGLKR